MTIEAVKLYVASRAATTTVTGTPWRKINTYSDFPKTDQDSFRCLTVVGEYRIEETRFRGARGLGTKQLLYQLDLLLQATHTDPIKGGRAFGHLVWNVRKTFVGGLPGQVPLTDPDTNESSVLSNIGERIGIHGMAPALDPENATLTVFRAAFTLHLTELVFPA